MIIGVDPGRDKCGIAVLNSEGELKFNGVIPTGEFESTLKNAESLGSDIPRGIIVYGRMPLMLTRNCPPITARSIRFPAALALPVSIRFPYAS